ncbi:hypothetical protein SETIT_5G202600v2 [Setaria italica]|uniref:Uncharacterized protein n=1 Tax=Setaria italica TaxID=4555 RepID=A0A368R6U0_SETIT|nr:hypothetical protein SETIT_5G202600v2 [Setaria italica]
MIGISTVDLNPIATEPTTCSMLFLTGAPCRSPGTQDQADGCIELVATRLDTAQQAVLRREEAKSNFSSSVPRELCVLHTECWSNIVESTMASWRCLIFPQIPSVGQKGSHVSHKLELLRAEVFTLAICTLQQVTTY